MTLCIFSQEKEVRRICLNQYFPTFLPKRVPFCSASMRKSREVCCFSALKGRQNTLSAEKDGKSYTLLADTTTQKVSEQSKAAVLYCFPLISELRIEYVSIKISL